MKKVLILVGVLLIGGLLFNFFRPLSYKNLPPSARGEWIAYGDSLTAGYGASEGNNYPAMLSQKLGIPILNMGVNGNTTADGLARLDEALALRPRVVLLCLGGNDGLQKLPSDQMISNLRRMITAFQQKGSFVVLIGVHSASVFDSNGGKFKKLASEEKAYYVSDILDGVLSSPALMSDQIHPNEAGYKAIADRLANILGPMLPKLK